MSFDVGLLDPVELLDDVLLSPKSGDGLERETGEESVRRETPASKMRGQTHSDRIDRHSSTRRRSEHGLLTLSFVSTEVDDLQEADWDEQDERSESYEGEIPAEDESDDHGADETGKGGEDQDGNEEVKEEREVLT